MSSVCMDCGTGMNISWDPLKGFTLEILHPGKRSECALSFQTCRLYSLHTLAYYCWYQKSLFFIHLMGNFTGFFPYRPLPYLSFKGKNRDMKYCYGLPNSLKGKTTLKTFILYVQFSTVLKRHEIRFRLFWVPWPGFVERQYLQPEFCIGNKA